MDIEAYPYPQTPIPRTCIPKFLQNTAVQKRRFLPLPQKTWRRQFRLEIVEKLTKVKNKHHLS